MMLHLVPEQTLIKTEPVDHADWNFRPLLGLIQRSRFHMLLDLMGDDHFDRLLEVGYGSGVFMPELTHRCRELHGVDVHHQSDEVARSLLDLSVHASLVSASAEAMPFDDASFDAIVAVSSFEFIADPERACLEICRVLKPGGAFFVVTPGHSLIVDLGLKVLTGADAQHDYADRREQVSPALHRHFDVESERGLPSLAFCLYQGYRLKQRA